MLDRASGSCYNVLMITDLILSDSTSIESASHNATTDELTIKFHTSATPYRYSGVSIEIAELMENAESAGRFYQSNIRGQFDSVKCG